MKRRLASLLLLLTLTATSAAPLAAGGPHCGMDRRVPAKDCGSCDLGAPERGGAAVSAGTCCRYEAATARATLPGVVPGGPRADDRGVASLPVTSFSALRTGLAAAALHGPSPPRSSPSPITLHSTLRL